MSGYQFVVDSSDESHLFNWCNANFELDFHIKKTADNTRYAAENAVAVVNGAFSLINQLKVDFNGMNVWDTQSWWYQSWCKCEKYVWIFQTIVREVGLSFSPPRYNNSCWF